MSFILQDANSILWNVTVDANGVLSTQVVSSGTATTLNLNDQGASTSWSITISTEGILKATSVTFNAGYPKAIAFSPAVALFVTVEGIPKVMGSPRVGAFDGQMEIYSWWDEDVSNSGKVAADYTPEMYSSSAGTLAGAAAVADSLALTIAASMAISGTAALTDSLALTIAAGIAIAGAATLTDSASVVFVSSLSLVGSSVLTDSANTTISASMSAAANAGVAESANDTMLVSEVLSGSASSASSAVDQMLGAASVSGSAAFSDSVIDQMLASIVLSTSSDLSASSPASGPTTYVVTISINGFADLKANIPGQQNKNLMAITAAMAGAGYQFGR